METGVWKTGTGNNKWKIRNGNGVWVKFTLLEIGPGKNGLVEGINSPSPLSLLGMNSLLLPSDQWFLVARCHFQIAVTALWILEAFSANKMKLYTSLLRRILNNL